jgi:transposase-like protein
VRTEEGTLYLFVAIDRTSKFVYAELHEKSDRTVASDFLSNLVKAVPYKIHAVLTDNGAQFCAQPRYRNGATARFMRQMFHIRCLEQGRCIILMNTGSRYVIGKSCENVQQIVQSKEHKGSKT